MHACKLLIDGFGREAEGRFLKQCECEQGSDKNARGGEEAAADHSVKNTTSIQ
jgi:hypothetical protein